jgi:endonuclease YncB( thermonuclease family)
MKNLFVFILFLCTLISTAQLQGTITRIKDGDTYVLTDSIKHGTTIRLAGVDCPEKKQEYGDSAAIFSTRAILNKEVLVYIDRIDMYGRTVGFIIYGKNKSLSRELLKQGLAWHYKKYNKSSYLASLERTAKKNKKGLWKSSNPINPEVFRTKK